MLIEKANLAKPHNVVREVIHETAAVRNDLQDLETYDHLLIYNGLVDGVNLVDP